MQLVHRGIKRYFFPVLIISIFPISSFYGAALQTQQSAVVQQPRISVNRPGFCGYEIPCCGCKCYCCKCCAECKAWLAVRSMPVAGQRVLAKRPSIALKGIAQNTGNFGVLMCARDKARTNTGITAEVAENAYKDELQKIDVMLAADSRQSVTKTESSPSRASVSTLQSSPPSMPSMMRTSTSTNSQLPNNI